MSDQHRPHTTASPFAAIQAPPVGIRHLLLWTLCTAAYLSLFRTRLALGGGLPEQFATLQLVFGLLQGMIIGAMWTGTIVLVANRIRRRLPLAWQPGHWLLWSSTAGTLFFLPLYVLVLLFARNVNGGELFFLITSPIYFVCACGHILGICYSVDVRWRLAFTLLAGFNTLLGLGYLAVYFDAFGAYGLRYWALQGIPSWGQICTRLPHPRFRTVGLL